MHILYEKMLFKISHLEAFMPTALFSSQNRAVYFLAKFPFILKSAYLCYASFNQLLFSINLWQTH